MDYLQTMRQLPPPTAQQIAAFAEHVADAHSWYKHLPITPAQPFYFYLDPNAGRATLHQANGEAVFVDITDPKALVHYATKLTSDYRQRFGFWAYEAAYGTSLYIQRQGGWMATEQTASNPPRVTPNQQRLAIFALEQGWLEVPDWLVTMGEVPVTALVHTRHNLFLSWASTSAYWRLGYPNYLDHALEGVPEEVLAALRAYHTFEQSMVYQTTREAHRETHQALTSWDEYTQWRETDMGQQYYMLYDQVEATMLVERERQLAVMRAAMGNIVAAIYGNVSP
ncbi:MAG: hypothetical protein ACOYNY_36825 [Caldilineaceae bacterium]